MYTNNKGNAALKAITAILLIVGLSVYVMSAAMTPVKWVPLIAGLLMLLYLTVSNFGYVAGTVSSRSFKYTTNAIIYSIVVILIVGVLNFIVAKQSRQWDLTKNKRYTLAEQSQKIVSGLKEDLKVVLFFADLEKPGVTDILKQYAFAGPRFKYEFVDPNKKPHIAEKYQVKGQRTTVLNYKDKTEKIYGFFGEQEMTNAIIRVTRPDKKSVYFLTGHGEADCDANDARGMLALKTALTDLNYNVSKINLMEKAEIPSDCRALVVAGPSTDLLKPEEEAITKFLNAGGHALFMFDPKPSTGLESFMKKYGIDIGSNLIIDPKPQLKALGLGDYTIPMAMFYDLNHDITKNFTVASFFPYARTVTPIPDNREYQLTQLVKTTPEAFADTTYLQNPNNIKFDEGVDVRGPLTVAAVCTKTIAAPSKPADTSENALKSDPEGKKSRETEMRLVVMGSSRIARNQYVNMSGNGNLVMNIMNYLAEEEDLIAIKPKTSNTAKIDMTNNDANNIFYITMLLMPGIVVLSGFTVWFYRTR